MTAKVRARSAPGRLACAPPKVPRATRGPFGAAFEGIDPDSGMYRIHVHGLDGEHRIFRRYSHFLNLREQLCASGLLGAAELPPMPPKSFFRKHFSEKFMFQRAACLRSLLQALVEIDRFVSTQALADFLAVGKAGSRQGRPKACKLLLSWVPEDFDGETDVKDEASELRSVLLANAEDTAGMLSVDQKNEISEKVGPEPLVKSPSRRVPGRLQRARARMYMLARGEESRPVAGATF